jgi:hypothetical protein
MVNASTRRGISDVPFVATFICPEAGGWIHKGPPDP